MDLIKYKYLKRRIKAFVKINFPILFKIIILVRKKNKVHKFLSYISFSKLYISLTIIKLFKKNVIGICLIEHIGDIIANEPISREVRRKHPKSIIIWFVRNPYKTLLKYNPAIDKVYTVNCLTSWIWLKERFTFEAIYELHFSGRACNVCNLPLIKINSDTPISSQNYLNHGSLLKAVCLDNKITVEDEFPKIYIPKKYFTSIQKKISLTKYIVIHCNSNETIKDWGKDNWEELIEQIISEYQYSVIEVGIKSSLTCANPVYYNYCGKLKLLETAALIKNASLFIGIDSGPAHMANASGTCGIVLLGEYYFGMKNYNPYSGNYALGRKCRLVYSAESVKKNSVEVVLKNINNLLNEINEIL